MPAAHSVEEHFEKKDATVPKKTSIHLVADTAFAGVATRRSKLVLTIKSATRIKNRRIAKCEKLSANRWHFELHLESPKDVDADVEEWLRSAYEISRANRADAP